jgi:hypothetical protein
VSEEVADLLGGFVLDASAVAALAGGADLYASTWAHRAAVRGIVLLVPATALCEARQRLARAGAVEDERLGVLLDSPMVVIDPMDHTAALDAGAVWAGLDLDPDVAAGQVIVSARARDWPVMAGAAAAAGLSRIDPGVVVVTLPGTA